jgi:hypothetical protein
MEEQAADESGDQGADDEKRFFHGLLSLAAGRRPLG